MRWGLGKSEKGLTSSDPDVQYVQNYPGANEAYASEPDYEDPHNVPCPAHTTERKLLTRIDLHVIPFLVLLYWLAFLDRVNISNANVFGLSEDLGLKGVQYNIALVIFFVPYVLFEIPANVLMKKFTPHAWLAGNMVFFGFVTIMQGLVKSYSGLLATRFFLGVFEAGMFPGCFYLIGMWYKRQEAQKRFSFFFSSTTLAGGFGGLIAAGIGKMDGVAGYQNWRWLFILEGAFTVIMALVVFFCLSDFPEEAKWLKPEEKAFVTARLRADQGHAARESKVTLKKVGGILSEFRVIIAGVMYFGLIVPAYSYAYFSPTIIRGFGYTPIQTQLHSVPPWAAAFGWSMIMATFSDLSRHRFGFIMFGICIAISAFAILISVHNNIQVQYAALFLAAMGCYSTMPFMVCWFNMNIGSHARRSVCSAWQVGFGNIGGIIAVFAFFPADAPGYKTGYSICIAFTILAMVATVLYGWSCISTNKKRDKMPTDLNLTEQDKADLGDNSPEYRFLL